MPKTSNLTRSYVLEIVVAAMLVYPAAAQNNGAGTAQSDEKINNMDGKQMDGRQMDGMDMGGMGHSGPAVARVVAGSGSGWGPASQPEHMWMTSRGGWNLMLHGVVFVDFNHQGGPRGVGKAESVNWAMTMEQHRLWRGTVVFRQMFSAESLTSPHPGFPELFQTGETYHGMALVDHQHPHNVFAELSLYYSRPLTEKTSWLLYGGPSAEPALGPVVYLHRASAAELPVAPLGHHLQDSTHTSFGVVTSGLVIDRIQIEGSAFNGREPNEERWSIQPAALDSWSGRISFAPSHNWSAQYSYGRLIHPEALEPGNERRQSASIEYNRPLERGNWATSLVWGRKHKEIDRTNQNSFLLESSWNFAQRNYAFTRLELVDKDELFPANPTHPSFRIGAYTFGGVRDVLQSEHWQAGIGADLTFYSKPATLDRFYGTRPVSFQIILRLRPSLRQYSH